MKQKTFFLLLFISFKLANGQVYRAITLKTKVLAPIGIALELPIYNKFTAEAGASIIGIGFIGTSEYVATYWGSLRYHFNENNKRSLYIYSGIKHKVHESADNPKPNISTRGTLDVYRLPLGIGIKNRRIDFYAGIDFNVHTKSNVYKTKSTYYPSETRIWKANQLALSVGLHINIFNIYIGRKSNPTLLQPIGN